MSLMGDAEFNEMDRDRQARISELRMAIVGYVRKHPDASDTPAGILKWWLPSEWTHEGADLIDETLSELARSGVLRCVRLPDGGLLYGANRSANDGT